MQFNRAPLAHTCKKCETRRVAGGAQLAHLAGNVAAEQKVDERLNAAASGGNGERGAVGGMESVGRQQTGTAHGTSHVSRVKHEVLHLIMSHDRCSLDMFCRAPAALPQMASWGA